MKTACAFVVLFSSVLLAQDHAPTVDQCRADQRLWWNQLDTQPEEISKLSYQKIHQRSAEMLACAVVDAEQIESYNRTGASLLMQLSMRLLDFIQRHNLTGQFLAEDRAGKR